MQHADLFFDFANDPDVKAAASSFFSAVGVTHYEERDSSNYVGDIYMEGRHRDVTYEIAYADDVHAGELRFWASMEGSMVAIEQFERLVHDDVARSLRRAGAQVSRVYELGKKAVRVVPYP